MSGDGAALLERKPSCVPGLLISAPMLRGTVLVYVVQDPHTRRVLEVRSKEHFIITMLDGSRSLAEIGEQYAARFGAALGPQQWQQMLGLLYRRGLLSTGMSAGAPGTAGVPVVPVVPVTSVMPVTPATAGAADAYPPTSSPGSGTVFSGKVRLVADAQALIERLYQASAFLRRRRVAAGTAVVVAAMLAVSSARLGELIGDAAYLMARPQLLLPVLTVLWVTQGMHELGHGIAARALGGRVSEIGLRWHWGTVLMYCRVEGVPFFPRRGRVTVALAGVYVNLLALVPFAAAWILLPAGGPARQVTGGLVAIGLVWGLANLIPLPPLDGYKALCYRLGVDRLATESRRYARLSVARRLDRGPAPTGYTARMRLLYGGYATVLIALPLVLAGAAMGATGVYLTDHFGRGALAAGGAVLGGTIVVWVLGMVFARVRARRHDDAGRAARDPGEETGPAPVRSPASADERRRPRKGMRPLSEHRPDPGAAAIEIRDVRKKYGGVAAVDGVSLTIRQGEFFGLLGPNGAGKTTLIEMICGLRRADSGSVTVLGAAPWPRDVALLSRIGVQTQASAFFTRLTALEHLRTVAALYDLGRESALAALDLVGLADQARLRVTALSGGQRQRLAIASALVQNPELVFLDEPTAALDPEARRDLWGLLRALKERGHTVVYTTHHLEEAEALCDRVAIMARGSVVACDTPANLMRTLDAPTRLYVPAEKMTADEALRIDGADRAFVDGGELVIETRDLGPVLVAVGQTVGFDAVRTRTASLEDAYLALIGTEAAR